MKYHSANLSSRGFTLMELMVVVGIIAFVTAAAMPSFSRSLLENRQKEVVGLIFEAVNSARALASQTGQCTRVRVQTSGPATAGGFGGYIAVDVPRPPTANTCAGCGGAGIPFVPVSFKAIGASWTDPINAGAGPHVSLVGQDVAISSVRDVNGAIFGGADPGFMCFEPTGGVVGGDRFFRVCGYSGATRVGYPRWVHVYASGFASVSPVPAAAPWESDP